MRRNIFCLLLTAASFCLQQSYAQLKVRKVENFNKDWKFYYADKSNHFTMENLLYIIAVVLVIGWLIGVFAYNLTGIIHVLLVLALISVLFNIIRGRRVP